jgi:hypothetical protein
VLCCAVLCCAVLCCAVLCCGWATADAASSTGRHAESAAFSEFREALAADYNVRWRLLSATIDFVARWVFTLGYGVAVLVVGITLTTDKRLV